MNGISYDIESEKLISGSITAISQTVDLTGPNSGTDVVQITGVWSGTIVVEGSQDGTNFVAIPFLDQSNGQFLTSITTSGMYLVASNGYNQTRVRSSAWTSGTATITAYGSNYSTVKYGAEDKNFGTVGVNTIRTASQIGNSSGTADFNSGATGAQTLRTVANQGAPNSLANKWPVQITDGTTAVDVTATGDLEVSDGLTNGGVYGNLILTTGGTAYEAKVGANRLTNRKSLTITALDDMYWGYDNGVTTSNGTPLFKNQQITFACDPKTTFQVWLVASASNKNARITEST